MLKVQGWCCFSWRKTQGTWSEVIRKGLEERVFSKEPAKDRNAWKSDFKVCVDCVLTSLFFKSKTEHW